MCLPHCRERLLTYARAAMQFFKWPSSGKKFHSILCTVMNAALTHCQSSPQVLPFWHLLVVVIPLWEVRAQPLEALVWTQKYPYFQLETYAGLIFVGLFAKANVWVGRPRVTKVIYM